MNPSAFDRSNRLSLSAKRAIRFAQTMTDYACTQGHDGTPPGWDKNCLRCAWMREQKQHLARICRQIEKYSTNRKRK